MADSNQTVPVVLDPTPAWYQSKKFWTAIGTVIVTSVVTYVMKHCGSSGQEILGLVLPIVGVMSSYIIGQSIVDQKVYSAIVNQSNNANNVAPISTDVPTKQ
jgi:hypothetical protein